MRNSEPLITELYKKLSDYEYRCRTGKKKTLIPSIQIPKLENGKLYYLLTDGNVIIDYVEK